MCLSVPHPAPVSREARRATPADAEMGTSQ
jgi:hypothetical protein